MRLAIARGCLLGRNRTLSKQQPFPRYPDFSHKIWVQDSSQNPAWDSVLETNMLTKVNDTLCLK